MQRKKGKWSESKNGRVRQQITVEGRQKTVKGSVRQCKTVYGRIR